MPSHVALLRGINVGKGNQIAMSDLRALLAGLGFADVSTYLRSGNALFSSTEDDRDALAARIEQAIADELGMAIRCVVRLRDDLVRVVGANPFASVATDPARLVVTFLSQPPDPARLADIDPAGHAPERFHVGEEEIYLWYPNGMRDAKLTHAFFEKRLGGGVAATARNWNTVTKLLDLMR
ncbi:MAG TPA: DUF1697 domain-containing protein [Micromonosporaceae bacterium]